MKQIEQRDEQLSALLDSALDEQQLDVFMQDLKRDPIADAETAQRYRLMGDAMRDELDQSSFMDISGAVHRAIENEPVLNETVMTETASKSTGFGFAEMFSNWLKPLTGAAVAASVAMVTLVTFNTVQNSNGSEQSAVQLAEAPKASQPMSNELERVNPEIARNVRVASTLNTEKKSQQQQKQLNHYLMQHSDYASQSTMQGMMPYVRAADMKAHEADE